MTTIRSIEIAHKEAAGMPGWIIAWPVQAPHLAQFSQDVPTARGLARMAMADRPVLVRSLTSPSKSWQNQSADIVDGWSNRR